MIIIASFQRVILDTLKWFGAWRLHVLHTCSLVCKPRFLKFIAFAASSNENLINCCVKYPWTSRVSSISSTAQKIGDSPRSLKLLLPACLASWGETKLSLIIPRKMFFKIQYLYWIATAGDSSLHLRLTPSL